MNTTPDCAARNLPCLPADPELSTLSIDALEDEIGALSSHLNAVTYRLLLLIAELDRREPWATFGCKTCAHYLNWKCGIALGAAREKVRTARALGDLPLISQAFGAGRLNYSKARALTRVANEHNEQSLLEIALAGTATHVERIVRHYRQMQATDSAEAIFDRRSFSCYWDDDGSLVFRGRLTAEQGAVLMQAIEQARVRPDEHNSHQKLSPFLTTARPCPSTPFSACAATARSFPFSKTMRATPFASAARPAPSHRHCAARSTGVMAAAASPAARKPAMSTPTTSSTGPTADRPILRILSPFAASTTPGCMRAVSRCTFQRRA